MEAAKVLEDEDEEEKDQFFTDLPPSGRPGSADGAPPSSGAPHPSSAASGGPAGEQERRAQIGASPYVAPFTPMGSPSRPKTPSSVGASQRGVSRGAKPQLVPVRSSNGPGSAAFTSNSKLPKDDVVTHLPPELAETLASTVQTLDKLISGVEGFRADQLGFLYDKASQYVELLRRLDAAGADYHAAIPLQVLQMLDAEDGSNPELFTKTQLERCEEESERAAGKADTLELLKNALEGGLNELSFQTLALSCDCRFVVCCFLAAVGVVCAAHQIANFLAEHSDRLGGQEHYQPTMGVRILELEKGKASVELWDVSGDQKYALFRAALLGLYSYEACWPAVMKDADGVILVYNPESHVHESEALLWFVVFTLPSSWLYS
ncbi:hypothetical protein BBJ28_00005035 [Nothophytophthora sp. Chile5]|nr:hypothetical protein BBJ28_00005035 [Nothophytophthora sp. Chile5]